ncbi:MAG: fibrobacter succinogenes major paralogous domain-containing protein [Prevotellaceae bacterium]|jgi:uncharacterized protein (TIGR02145 family)|nr:fibrobacter succinogenes major paralogous domain-containing protein [Prevotellaceae bacterium]
MTNNLFVKTFLLCAITFCEANVCSQVTVGVDSLPQRFSLLELIGDNTRGLRLPQMNTSSRDIMTATAEFIAEKNGRARGLQIFNTTTHCVETWNGQKWIVECMPCDDISFPTLGTTYNFCNGATIADLEAKTGGADIYNSASGGNKYASTVALSSSVIYYAEQRVANCTPPARTALRVNLGNCNLAPNANLTAFVNVMYDFQHQTLEAYSTAGIGTDYEWSVSTSGSAGSFTPIANAPNSPFFTVPANFADNYYSGSYKSETLWFKCKITNSKGYATTADNLLDIIFIKTTSAGYSENNGVKYLTLRKGQGGSNGTGTMKVALLSLGQSADWTPGGGYVPNNDAGDIGDFYQWGRVADGHQNVVWSKNASRSNQIIPFGTTPANTADTLSYRVNTRPAYNTSTHQVVANDVHYGKFIKATDATSNGNQDWYYSSGHDNALWGTASNNDRSAQGSLTFTWTRPGNNPCPSGWRIPSRWNWWDIYRGTGTDTDILNSNYAGLNNTWQWRASNGTSATAFGGAIVTNPNTGEKIFLPASGFRYYDSGELQVAGTHGRFWSSTYYDSPHQSLSLGFTTNNVGAGNNYNGKADARHARCVAEF